jgi:diguanylate cyclase (GGDEF)-like protein
MQTLANDKQKLITALSVLLSLGFIITSFASYFVSKETIRKSIIKDELPLTSDNIYSEIQKDLVRPTFISSMMASDTFLRDWVLDGEKDLAQITKYLGEIKNRYGTFASFYVSERTGNYYHPGGILKQISPKDEHDVWYYRVRAMKQPYEISVDTNQADKDALTIFINYHVYDYADKFLGVAGIGLTVDAVRKLIDSYQERYDRIVYFVDLKGDVALYSNHQTSPGDNIRRIEGLQAQADTILKSQSGSYQYKRDGRVHLLNVRFIPELDWYLFVEKMEDEALAEIKRTLYMNLALCMVITGVVLTLTNITINRYQRRLEEMATTDKLTGLANRQACELFADQAMKLARRNQEPLSAILIDIDHFKQVNDRYGHLAGDAVIKQLAETIQGCLRESDFLCRWGGEEYLLLMKGCDLNRAQIIAEHLRTTVKEAPIVHEGVSITVTISLGVAEHRDEESNTVMFGRADEALYRAKASGRDRVCTAD